MDDFDYLYDTLNIPKNCILIIETIEDGDTTRYVTRCKAIPNINVVNVKGMGGMTKISLQFTVLQKGTNTHAIHEYNVASGFITEDDIEAKKRASESLMSSISRTRHKILELVACNPWQYFVTVTLSSEKWNRFDPDGLQTSLNAEAQRWKRKQRNHTNPYKDYAYLFVPELHKRGGIHLHGCVTLIPDELLIPYTLEDVNSSQNLPIYICEKVRAGELIYHCKEWDDIYGFNVVEPILDQDKLSNYIIKYITKDLMSSPFPSRYWRSRGLKTAETIARFQVPNNETAIADYNDYVIPIAAVTSTGKVLHHECYLPPVSPEDRPMFVGISTTVGNEIMTPDDTVNYLALKYPRRKD